MIAPPRATVLRRPSRHFIGRERETELFEAELDVPIAEGGRFLVSISGIGGVGKTTLVQRLLERRPSGVVCLYLDERDAADDALAVAGALARQLVAALGPSSFSGAALASPRLATAAQHTPADAVLALTNAVVDDVNRLAQQGRAVWLVLDTYEVLRYTAGLWLLEWLLSGRATPITGNLRIVISGREPLERTDPRWARDWLPSILSIPLVPFSRDETQAFLQAGPTVSSSVLPVSADQVRQAVRATGGLPVWLELWRQRWAQGGAPPEQMAADDTQTVVDRFLMWWDDPRQRHWVRTAWIPRWFNLEVLRVLLGSAEEAEAAHDWLTRQASIIFSVGGRWTFHPAVRLALMQETVQRNPREVQEQHDRLAAHWQEAGPADALGDSFYHAVRGTLPEEGMRALLAAYVSAALSGGAAHSLVGVAGDLLDEGMQAPGLTLLQEHWAALQSGEPQRLAELRQQLAASGLLPPRELALLLAEPAEQARQLAPAAPARTWTSVRPWWARFRPGWRGPRPRASAEQGAQAQLLQEHGDMLRLAGQFDAALESLNAAVALDASSAVTLASRGEVLRMLGRVRPALDDLSVALALAPTEGWIWVARAMTYLAANQPRRALRDADRAVRLRPDDPWAVGVQGLALAAERGALTREAESLMDQALERDGSLRWVRDALEQWRAETARRAAASQA